MAIGMTPYLQFPGTAREALELYHSVFGGELSFMTYAEGMGEEGESRDRIMHGSLYIGRGVHLMAADLPEGMSGNGLGTIALSVSEANAGENGTIEEWWAKLSAHAEVTMPLETAPWGDKFGMLKDTFGVEWMFNTAEGGSGDPAAG